MKDCIILTLAVLVGISAGRGQTTSAGASAAPPPAASPSPPPSAPAKKSAAELQKLVEPIALHPDPLIAMILPASAYPLEIVQAARFVKDTNNVSKVDDQPWDENVKGVAKFPELIAKMDADLSWTISLGQGFIDQPKEVMEAVQELRSKAQKLGKLKTTDQQIVTVTNIVVQQTNVTEVVNVTREVIEIAPANPSVIYVPSYPPTIYYPWYPYYAYAAPLVSFGVGFAWGMALGAAWSHCNWGGGCVDIDIDSNRNVNRNTDRNRAQTRDRGSNTRGRDGSGRQQWKADQNRMQRSGANPSTREARGWSGSRGSGGARPSTGNLGSRPSTGNVGARPSTGNVGARPSTGNASARPSAGGSSSRGSSPSVSSRSSSGNSAYNRSSGGSSTRSYSSRGSSSRGGGGYSGGGSRGGGGRGGGGGGRR